MKAQETPMHNQSYRKRIEHYSSLIFYSTLYQIKSEISLTYLGFLWWIIEPLLFLSIYYFVFAVVLHSRTENFLTFLFIGLVFWRWFSAATTKSCRAIVSQKNLMQEISIAKVIFPITIILLDTIKFLVILACMLIFIIMLHDKPALAWISLIPIIVTEVLLIMGVGICFSAITPFIPDLPLVITATTQGLMFMSGVFFDITKAPEKLIFYLKLNPIADLLLAARQALISHQWPEPTLIFYPLTVAILLIIIGSAITYRNDKIYPKVCQ